MVLRGKACSGICRKDDSASFALQITEQYSHYITRRCIMKRWGVMLCVLVAAAGLLAACGGGGGGGGAAPLTTPTYNLTGYWTMNETVTSTDCTPAPSGTLTWYANVTQASGSNTVYVKDTRALASDPAAAMTMSGSALTYSGQRYNEDQSGCDSMTASYVISLSTATSFSNGSGTLHCNWSGGSCYINTTISGHQ